MRSRGVGWVWEVFGVAAVLQCVRAHELAVWLFVIILVFRRISTLIFTPPFTPPCTPHHAIGEIISLATKRVSKEGVITAQVRHPPPNQYLHQSPYPIRIWLFGNRGARSRAFWFLALVMK